MEQNQDDEVDTADYGSRRQYKEIDARETGKKQDDDVTDADYGRRKTIQRNRCQEEWKKNKMTVLMMLMMTEEGDNKSK